jgi:nifR3 family TIM-barrel protein
MAMRLGNIHIPHGLFLGPMAGYTDYAFRRICREWGAEYLTTEMVSAKAITFSDKKTAPIACVHEGENPCAVQLFGHESMVIADAAQVVAKGMMGGVAPTSIDINMGCPVKKIVGAGDGSALMKTPDIAVEIVRAVKRAVDIPVSVKIRIGWDRMSINAPAFACLLEEAGADMICVHGRTRSQGYSGTADWDVIRRVKEAVSVPVVANGDVRDVESGLRILDVTGCDGIMIGRAAVGNPFLFGQIAAGLDGREIPHYDSEVKFKTAMRHLEYAIEDKGEMTAILESRKQLGSYFLGYQGGAPARFALNQATTYEEIEGILRGVFFR